MIDRIIYGISENWLIVSASLLLLVGGTIAAYQKHGLKRVLLGKNNDNRELIYYLDGKVNWKPTIKSWGIILTGGMSLLTVFLLIMLLSLAFIYAHDIQSTNDNNELLCKEFGTVYPTLEQLEVYYGRSNPSFSKLNLTVNP